MKRIFARLTTIILAVLLAGCAPSAAVVTETPGTPVSAAPSVNPEISPADEPTETPELSPSPTASPESVFIVNDDVWAGAKEIVDPEYGDWVASGYAFVEPGTEIRSPYDAMASFHKIPGYQDGKINECIILTARPDESESWEYLTSNPENYPILFVAVDITPAFNQYEKVKEGEVIGTVNSADLGLTPEQYEEYGLYSYNLCISCPQPMQSFNIGKPFADELTLKDKIMFIVELVKKAQSEPTKEN